MRRPEYVRCRACQAEVSPGGQFCPRCGASLWDQGYREDGHLRVGRIVKKTIFRLVVVAIFAGAIYGLYYAADRYVIPRFRDDTSSAVTASNESTTSTEQAATTTTTNRKDLVLKGADRYETAIVISQQGYTGSAPAVVLANGNNFTDLLCGAPLARTYGGPLLFVPRDGLYSSLKTELTRLNPTEAFIVGGSFSVDVRAQVRELLPNAKVTRLVGGDQYETAALVADKMAEKLETVAKVVVVPDDDNGPGLAVASLAAAKGWPILLTPKMQKTLPRSTRREITKLKVDTALVVGDIQGKVDVKNIESKTGKDQYELSALLAQYGATVGLDFKHVVLATGEAFPDAIAAAPYAAIDKGVLLLTNNEELPSPISALLTANRGKTTVLDFVSLSVLAKQLGSGASTTSTTATSGSSTTTGT